MKNRTKPLLAGAALLVSLLAACASTTPQWDAHFGDAVRTVRAQQLADPAAPASLDPVRGIDGRAARAAQERYEHSFREPPAAPAPVVGAAAVK